MINDGKRNDGQEEINVREDSRSCGSRLSVFDQASILTADQRRQVDRLAATLDREQTIWTSGYLAGLASAATTLVQDNYDAQSDVRRASVARTTGATVLFGSETGNSRQLASEFATAATARGIETRVVDMADYKPRALKDEQNLLVVTATHGEGDPPQTAVGFFEFLEGRRAPRLPQLRFAVLALGDSTYEHFCSAGRRVDERLAELGAQRVAARVDCDVDYEDGAVEWIAAVLDKLAVLEPASVGATSAIAARDGDSTHNGHNGASNPRTGTPPRVMFDKRKPFAAAVLDNIVLTGRGSTKETRHVELSLEGSGLTYRPGDALGIVARNDPSVVAALLQRLGLSADATVTVKGQATTLVQALADRFEITAATPRFLDYWAQITDAIELQDLRTTDQTAARTAFLRTHHISDIIERFLAPGVDPDGFLTGLRPLQPRLYSIASSLAAAPDEAHLTVSTVRYTLHDRPRTGVASGHLAGLIDTQATVPVYIQPNDHFHLPDDDDALLMIGAGTGIAPYRAFMQEREARGAAGRSWLFFGERNFRSDFLYQVEWQDWLKRGVLSRLDLAFSRDATPKTYVQHRLHHAGADVYAWLEEGARLYVCGDATHMAPDVHAALLQVVSEHGAMDHDAAEDYLASLKRDRRYRLDVY